MVAQSSQQPGQGKSGSEFSRGALRGRVFRRAAVRGKSYQGHAPSQWEIGPHNDPNFPVVKMGSASCLNKIAKQRQEK
jgi:hypothetical protein